MRYAYIGGGATTTALLVQHIRLAARELGRSPRADGIAITIFDRSGTFGPGLPYSDASLDCHIVNMEADTVSIEPDDREHFVRWLIARQTELRERYPGLQVGPLAFPPRTVVGRYLVEQFQEAERAAAQNGIRVQRSTADAVDIVPMGGRLFVRTADDVVHETDRVVVATGHWDPTLGRECWPLGRHLTAEGKGGFLFPWPARALRADVPTSAHVAVLGTSLSAIDAAFTLLDEGGDYVRDPSSGRLAFRPQADCRNVVMYSRRGLLPRVRSTWPAPVDGNPHLSKASVTAFTSGDRPYAFLDDIITAFRSRLEWARGNTDEPFDLDDFSAPPWTGDVTAVVRHELAGDLVRARHPTVVWNRIHHAIRDSYSALARLYPRLSTTDQEQFMETFFRQFNRHAGSMPAENAEKVVALLDSGRLRVVAGFHHIRPCDKGGVFEIVLRDPAQPMITPVAYVVNAIGQERSLDIDGSPLLCGLLRRGLASTHPSGGLFVDYDSSRLVEPSGRPSSSIFAIGAMTLGQRIGSSALIASAKFGRSVAEAFVRDILNIPR